MSGSILVLLLMTVASAPGGGGGGVTRTALTAYAIECKTVGRRMDLIERFGKDFSGLDLSGVDFRGVHAIRLETNLAGADFSGANLAGAQFGAANLEGANFTGANLENADFVTASLIGANFQAARLKGVRFQECQIAGANLAGLDLSQTALNSSNLAHAQLSRSVLAGEETNNCWGVEFQNANLTGADLHGLKLSGNSFRAAILRSANLEGADLEQADFSAADLTGARLANANVKGADFGTARGLSDGEREQLLGQARRWQFELTSGVRSFLDSLAFPIVLFFVVPLIGFGPRWLSSKPSIHSRTGDRRPSWQFSLTSLLLVVLGMCVLLGVATWSLTGAFSYTMVCAFYLMVAEAASGPPKQLQGAKLLALALAYPILNFVVFVVAFNLPSSLFNPVFMSTVTFFAPLAAVAIAVLTSLSGRAPFPWLGMIGFVVWMTGVAFVNLFVIGSAAASV